MFQHHQFDPIYIFSFMKEKSEIGMGAATINVLDMILSYPILSQYRTIFSMFMFICM